MIQPAATSNGSFAGLAADDLGQSDDRPPLVLLHGLTFDRRMWRRALAELEALDPARRVLSLDLPAHGESPDRPPYGMDAIVDLVHAAISEARLDDPILVGHSYSAGMVAMYAARYPSRGVVAVEGTLRVAAFAGMAQAMEPLLRGPGFIDAWSRITDSEFRLEEVTPEVRDFVIATSKPRQEVVLGYWQDLFGRTSEELSRWVVRATAAVLESGVPFVAVSGRDPSPAELTWLAEHLPESRTLVWPGSGHFPPIAHPRRFAELLAETAAWADAREVQSTAR